LPTFTWNEGYPARVEQCLYVFHDLSVAISYATGCCGIDLGQLVCGSRGDNISQKLKFRWRLMLLDCESQSFTDVTGAAVTQIQPFEGELDRLDSPLDRDCETKKFTAMPEFFEDPPVVCP
jgi:hypothetical protein